MPAPEHPQVDTPLLPFQELLDEVGTLEEGRLAAEHSQEEERQAEERRLELGGYIHQFEGSQLAGSQGPVGTGQAA